MIAQGETLYKAEEIPFSSGIFVSFAQNPAKSGGSAHQSSQAYKTAAPGEGSCRLRKFLRFLISGINLYNVHL
jgi:hypothetical protein